MPKVRMYRKVFNNIEYNAKGKVLSIIKKDKFKKNIESKWSYDKRYTKKITLKKLIGDDVYKYVVQYDDNLEERFTNFKNIRKYSN